MSARLGYLAFLAVALEATGLAATFAAGLTRGFTKALVGVFLASTFLATGLGLFTVTVLGLLAVEAVAFLATTFLATAFLAAVGLAAGVALVLAFATAFTPALVPAVPAGLDADLAAGFAGVLTAGFALPGFLAAWLFAVGLSAGIGSDAFTKPRTLACLSLTGLSPQISSRR